MKKKVWLINQYAMPPKYEVRIQTLKRAQYLIELGHDVTIISGSYLHNTTRNLITDNEKYIAKEYDGIKFIHVKTKKYNRLTSTLRQISFDLTRIFATPSIGIKVVLHVGQCCNGQVANFRLKIVKH